MPNSDKASDVSRRGFLQKAAWLSTALGMSAGAAARQSPPPKRSGSGSRAKGKSFTGKRPEDYRVILQDIGDPLLRMEWPPSPERLIEGTITPLKDAAIDMYAYGINHAGGITHCSDLYPKIGEEQEVLRSGNTLRMYEAVQQLCAAGHDPLQILCDGGHAAGMDVYLRLRMNDHHDRWGDKIDLIKPSTIPKTRTPEPYYYSPQWKKDHPEWLIGDRATSAPKDSFEYMEASAGNYAVGPYREMMFKLAEETVTKYDLDGFELDFFRSPFLFPNHEAYVQRHVMTAFVRRIRKVADERGASRGRPIFLSARVPATVDLCLRIGIDLPVWLEEGLLDSVVISNGLSPFSTPWREIADLGEQHGIPAQACFTYARPTREGIESLRAATLRAFSAGISGIELWNYFYAMGAYRRPDQKHPNLGFTHEMVDSEALRTGAKTYLLDGSPHVAGGILKPTFGHAEWPGQTPMMIGYASDGIGNTATFDVADDLKKTKPESSPRVWVRLTDVGHEDKLAFLWNGKPIQPDPETFGGIALRDSHEFEFQLLVGDVRFGENHLEIRLLERSPRLEPYITLVDGRLTIPALSG